MIYSTPSKYRNLPTSSLPSSWSSVFKWCEKCLQLRFFLGIVELPFCFNPTPVELLQPLVLVCSNPVLCLQFISASATFIFLLSTFIGGSWSLFTSADGEEESAKCWNKLASFTDQGVGMGFCQYTRDYKLQDAKINLS